MRGFIESIITHEVKIKQREIAAKVESHRTRKAAMAKALVKARLEHISDLDSLKRDLANLNSMIS